MRIGLGNTRWSGWIIRRVRKANRVLESRRSRGAGVNKEGEDENHGLETNLSITGSGMLRVCNCLDVAHGYADTASNRDFGCCGIHDAIDLHAMGTHEENRRCAAGG